LISNACT
jgi:hypothetical protein